MQSNHARGTSGAANSNTTVQKAFGTAALLYCVHAVSIYLHIPSIEITVFPNILNLCMPKDNFWISLLENYILTIEVN